MKFVSPLNEATSKELGRILHDDRSAARRERAHAVLVSNKGFSLDDLARIFDRDRDTISSWLTRWEERAYDGLSDEPRSGRPPKTSAKEDKQILRIVKKMPHNLRQVRAVIRKKKIDLSQRTLQRRLCANKFRFRRIKKRPPSSPDPLEYRKAQRRLRLLRSQEQQGNIELVFGDAAGFAVGQTQHYAWQHKDEPLWIDALSHQRRLNVIGFLSNASTKQSCSCTVFEKSIDDRCMIAAVDDMLRCRKSTLPLVLVLDNAPYHHTDQMMEAQERWKRQNVTVEYLPRYSPKLNTIEVLWKFIKYYWLPLEAFYSFSNLRKHLYAVLNGIGTKYRITFVN